MDLVTPASPEEILPLEVWGLILDHLRSPSDLLNCNKVCKAWKKLLELKKTTFLMPKVFPILLQYFKPVRNNDEDDNVENKEEEEPIATIIKMRLISHGWKETVDNYHQTHPALNDIGFKPVTEDGYSQSWGNSYDEPFRLVPYRFNDGEASEPITKLESCLLKGFSPGSNPFITRYVKFCDVVINEQQQSRLKIAFKNMLEAFGSHIWTCELYLITETNKVNFYKLVSSYLRLMPNLRSLHVRFMGQFDNENPQNNSEKEGLESLLYNEPLPRLEHLTKLGMSKIPYPLSVGLLATNGHVQKLLIEEDYGEGETLLSDSIVNVQLSSLKQLTLNCTGKQLLHLHKVRWPIKALRLTIRDKKEALKNIFLAVSSTFGNTLEHFVVQLCNGMENNEELELPNLKIFQLYMRSKLETIDFLQRCTALEKIQLAFKVSHTDMADGDEDSSSSSSTDEEDNAESSTDEDEEDYEDSSADEEDNAVIQFKHCIFSMNQSNIWRILNNLKSITLKTNGKKGQVYHIFDNILTLYEDEIHQFRRRQFEKFSNPNWPRDSRVPENE